MARGQAVPHAMDICGTCCEIQRGASRDLRVAYRNNFGARCFLEGTAAPVSEPFNIAESGQLDAARQFVARREAQPAFADLLRVVATENIMSLKLHEWFSNCNAIVKDVRYATLSGLPAFSIADPQESKTHSFI